MNGTATPVRTTRAEGVGPGRQIGPIGTLARTVGGALAIALPIAFDGFSWWEAAVALVALPLIALVVAALLTLAFRRLAPNALKSRHAICSLPGCSLIAVMVAANAALVAPTSANGNVTIWVWLGASMLLAAARGYGGCEMLAISNLITGRREQIGCLLYTPIDNAEKRRRAHRPTHPLSTTS
ncbi:MAG: hypothetical protein ACRDK7_11275 [Solirubrobacteraceae bacterium]